jgi:hypothetical protein
MAKVLPFKHPRFEVVPEIEDPGSLWLERIVDKLKHVESIADELERAEAAQDAMQEILRGVNYEIG